MRTLKILAAFLLVMSFSASAYAERGLGGKYTKRHMTQGAGTLKILAGPSSHQLLGFGMDAGFQFVHPEASLSVDLPEGVEQDVKDQIGFNLGAAYGVTDDIEVGAIFAPLAFAPDGVDTFQNVPVFATYSMNMGNYDIGGRITAVIPIVENSDFQLMPGVPVLFRGNGFRLDTGLFLPVTFADDTLVNAAIPVRVAFQATTNIYGGIETGLNLANLVGPENSELETAIPLGVFFGYTLPAGGSMIDFGLSFNFDNALWLSAPEGFSTTQFANYRLNAGANVQMKF